ncbi:MAG: Arc family DNA binding domain-containing protein [Candidatus Latescibacterota bacterium]|nr:MAG: Arc family DNA binding domain-containing protein [Candidatus Latescibacterota bacterium]
MAARKTFLLRITPELWDELNRWAGQELRSVNGQIEFLLRRAVEERKKKARKGGEEGQKP